MHGLSKAVVMVVAIAAGGAGCASRADYAKNVNSFVDQPIDSVVLAMGPPDSSFELADGRWVFEWEDLSIEHRLDPQWGRVSYVETNHGRIVPIRRPSAFGSNVNDIMRICTTRFMTGPERVVRDVTFEGDGCRG